VISVMVDFGGLRDLSDGRFSVSVVFFFITRFQWRSVLVGYVISVMVGFGGLRDLNGGQFSWLMRLQRRSVLFRYEF